MMTNTFQSLYINHLKDLYSAENQLVKALPKMVKSAESQELSDAFRSHLEQTKNHVMRLEDIFQRLGETPKGQKCVGMEGIIKEGVEVMGDFEGEVLDAGLISAAQRMEHYEIATYGTVCAMAEVLGRSEDLGILKGTLEEEKQADERLTELSEAINASANQKSEPGSAGIGKQTSKSQRTRTAA